MLRVNPKIKEEFDKAGIDTSELDQLKLEHVRISKHDTRGELAKWPTADGE